MSAMLEKVAKLLNQAENAATAEEAEAFMTAAQRLATSHSVDLAKARHITKDKQKTVPVQRSIHIGDRKSRGLRTLTDLYLGIAEANDIKCMIAHNATRVYAYGFAEDIDVSEALFASLLTQQAKLAGEYKASDQWRDEKAWQNPYTVYRDYDGKACKKDDSYDEEYHSGCYKPITWATARINFQDGFASRISARLAQAKREEERQLIADERRREQRPHLDEDDVPTAEFASWMQLNYGIELDDLDDTTGEASQLSARLKDVDDEWAQQLVEQYKAALSKQASAPGTALVLASKREAVNALYAPVLKRSRGSYKGHDGTTASWGSRNAGRKAADRASLGESTAIGVKKAIGR